MKIQSMVILSIIAVSDTNPLTFDAITRGTQTVRAEYGRWLRFTIGIFLGIFFGIFLDSFIHLHRDSVINFV
jgi:hypothetical protein